MKMTANRRIALNIAATYVRNAYTLALGLVTARWLLLSLGQTDYGLFGVVGGLIALVAFINQTLANAIGRFYAVSIGRMKRKGERDAGLADCRRWFTLALVVHTLVPLLLVAVGYPLGLYAVDHWLVIPADRIVACRWVWRFSCLTSLLSMMNVPFHAMYTAKQEIAELTGLSVVKATFGALLLYYMVSHPGDWLSRYAFWHCLIAAVPMLIICLRAIVVYPECRVRRECLFDRAGLKQLCSYAGWNAFAMFGTAFKAKGLMILVNLFFTPACNAAMTVATRFSSKTNTFASSMVGAFAPAVAQAYGKGDLTRFRSLVIRMSKLAGVMTMLAAVPLCLEAPEILRLWLKEPPEYSPFLCVCVMATFFMDKMSIGHRSAIAATGRIVAFRLSNGTINIITVPAILGLIKCGYGMRCIGIATLVSKFLIVSVRACLAQRIAGISLMLWLRTVAIPILCSACAGIAVWVLFVLPYAPSVTRVFLTVGVTEAVMVPMVWFWVISHEEREYFFEKCVKVLSKLRGRPTSRPWTN